MQVCAVAGCPELSTTTYCDDCAKAKDKARGTRQQRGYGAQHQRTRAALLPDAYGALCIHCDERMWPHQALALDHTEDRTGYRGIVHASCNASEGATRGNRWRNV
jgi:hypothetical protein